MLHTIGLSIAMTLGGLALPSASSEDCNGNGIADSAEIAAATHYDSNHNGKLDCCEGLSVDLDRMSLSKGGTQQLRLDLGSGMAGSIYWVLGSLAGDAPGTSFGYAKLPLNFDGPGAYMAHTVMKVNAGMLKNGLGLLGAGGTATARFVLPPGFDPALAGMSVHHAFVILTPDLQLAIWASNSVVVQLEP